MFVDIGSSRYLYWVTGTPTKRELQLAPWRADTQEERESTRITLLLLHGAVFVLYSIAGVVPIIIYMTWWIGLLAAVCGIGLFTLSFLWLIRKHVKLDHEITAFHESGRVHKQNVQRSYEDESAFHFICWSLPGEKKLLSRHTSEVDDFLLDPDIRRIDELLAGRALSEAKRQELKKVLIAKSRVFCEHLRLLDQPYQEEEAAKQAAENEAEDAKRLDALLTQEARRQVADDEATRLIRQLENEL